MPGYANIGGSWRELSSGYANIGGTWRQISEGYQNRGGVWEKVFPNYPDYGGDTPDIWSGGYIDKYGYYVRVATNTGNHSSSEGETAAYNITNTYFNNMSLSSSDGVMHWFASADLMDLRGYSYMAVIGTVYITSTESSSSPSHNFECQPIMSFSDSVSKLGSTIKRGSNSSQNRTYKQGYTICILVDISSLTESDKYLQIGVAMGTTYSGTSNSLYGRLNMNQSGSGMWLYKNKSDCPYNTSDYDYGWTMTY